MKLTAPLVFEPLYMERVWGGRKLETLFGKSLPSGAVIGEAWELVDRAEAQSVVHTGPLRGSTLHELWTGLRTEIFGARYAGREGRFPIFFKLLDAAEKLSVQVHPTAAVAPELKGEPKTEMWYVADAEEGADLYAGLKAGTTREQFEKSLQTGRCADLLHRIPTKAGDCIFIPSGRVHAIGGGNVIVEVQQNSDTTYRVFDWNRTGLDGKPRALHVAESLRSIDFADYEPQIQPPESAPLIECPYFAIERWDLDAPREAAPSGDFAVITCLSGKIECAGETFGPGHFFLVPATLEDRLLKPAAPHTALLRTTLP
ncbi:MAG: class I mannose-6-phosphate isomerase [Chthoniobacteraceae bacterium]|nr:class I mannose-6-phosphate isomerase [Chthoniobacteraceae bacterium]